MAKNKLNTDDRFQLPYFKAAYTSGSYSARLQRRVLNRVWISKRQRQLPSFKSKKTFSGKAERQCVAILNRYRHRLEALRPIYIPLRRRPTSFIDMANCRPSHFVPVEQQRFSFCQNRLVCPWCYARWAREIYDAVDKVLFDTPGMSLSLVIERTHEELFLPPYNLSAVDAWFLILGNKMAIKPQHTLGNFSWCVWRILPNGSLYCYRQLLAVAPDDGTSTLTPRQVCDKLSTVLTYPRSWLTADPALAGELFNIQLLHRSFRRYGIFRGRKQNS